MSTKENPNPSVSRKEQAQRDRDTETVRGRHRDRQRQRQTGSGGVGGERGWDNVSKSPAIHHTLSYARFPVSLSYKKGGKTMLKWHGSFFHLYTNKNYKWDLYLFVFLFVETKKFKN